MNIPNILRKRRGSEAQIRPELTHYGIKLLLPEAVSETELVKLLTETPSGAYRLPKDKGIVLDFGTRECSRKLILNMLQSVIWEKNINVLAWISHSEESLKLFSSTGLCVSEPVLELNPPSTDDSEYLPGLEVIYTSMRSGQRVEAAGDVVIWGHINPGAEVKAGGSILVAGRLLGIVHAGAYGREDVFLWAGSFETPQVRIANKLCYSDAKSTSCWRKSALITLENGTPVIREYKFLSGGNNP